MALRSKYVIVVGGVYSGTGKGISAASIAMLLKMRGENVTLVKCDPYLNMNAGTMNPRQHGEVFLCDDGSETDLDLGHYERIAGVPMSSGNIFTNGKLYQEIFEQEERGDFLGETVQIVPHVTDKVQKRLLELGENHSVVIAEIGGTVGDYESAGMFSAIAQFKNKYQNDVIIVMVAPIISNDTVKELKTKPLQNAIRDLRGTGLHCDMLLCRCDQQIPEEELKKLLDKVSKLTFVPRHAVFDAPKVDTIYRVPIEFFDRNIDDLIVDQLRLKRNSISLRKYERLVQKCSDKELPVVNIGVISKYENCDEAYVSLKEAIIHAGANQSVRPNIIWINAEDIEKNGIESLDSYNLDGIIVPGGFDKRGVLGKMTAIQYSREKNVPFLGICLGMQCAVIEFAKNILNIEGANSQEFDKKCINPVIHYIEGQHDNIKKSGTMRLGSYECELTKDSLARELYKKKTITERHRHRYEVNNAYIESLESAGMMISGRSPDSALVEMIELRRDLHPYFIATQAHPEFKSRLGEPSPLFDGLIKAAYSFSTE